MIVDCAVGNTIVPQHVVRLLTELAEFHVETLQAVLWAAVDFHVELYELYGRGKGYYQVV